MKKFFKVTFEIIAEAARCISHFLSVNLINFAAVLTFILPYAMYCIGQHLGRTNETLTVGCELLIPVGVYIIVCFLKSFANRIGKGTTIPLPNKRFTTIDDGEVSIEHGRLYELLLYLADLEDWFERKGLL